MKPELTTSIVFGLALLFNWKLIFEDYSTGHLDLKWAISANGALLLAAIIFSLVYLRRVIRRIQAVLIASGAIQKNEKVVKWSDALLAPLPVLFTMTYSWLPTSQPLSKFTLQYGGTAISGLLYVVLVAFLLFSQIENKLKGNGV